MRNVQEVQGEQYGMNDQKSSGESDSLTRKQRHSVTSSPMSSGVERSPFTSTRVVMGSSQNRAKMSLMRGMTGSANNSFSLKSYLCILAMKVMKSAR